MQVLRTLEEVGRHIKLLRSAHRSIALVPTMGGLHPGHIALVRRAVQYADTVIASVFINPMQFDCDEDFRLYPRNEQQDFACLRANSVEYVFAPAEHTMVMTTGDDGIYVTPGSLGLELCGHYRPSHFRGVLTMVAKLLNIFSPDVAVFGEKDYQQLFLIRKMVESLNFACHIAAVPTVRDGDGLAYSSRNSYLSHAQKQQALILYARLSQLACHISTEGPDISQYAALSEEATNYLNERDFEVEYLEVRDADTLLPGHERSRRLIAMAAAHLGKARLIDNVLFHP